jgi:hypothetical protein
MLSETEVKINTSEVSETSNSSAEEFKKRMLEWNNPVEFVNNMYGCHPDDNNSDYFKVVFSK